MALREDLDLCVCVRTWNLAVRNTDTNPQHKALFDWPYNKPDYERGAQKRFD